VKIVVDTNIVFSALLNTSGNIGKILTHYNRHFEFYSCQYLKEEIQAHWIKLRKFTKISDEELTELIQLTTGNIQFINETILPEKNWAFAVGLLKNLDHKDVPFVALNHHLKAHLWTGEKRLVKGLLKQGYSKVLTQDLIETLEK
jgi:predicted nucleic acid-binding protein